MQSSKLSESVDLYSDATAERLSRTSQLAHTLVEQGARDDPPTGRTPRKRSRTYVEHWELTKSRELILKGWRHAPSSVLDGDTSVAEIVPLPPPEDEENLDPAQVELDSPIFEPDRDPDLAISQSSTLTAFTSSTSSGTSIPPTFEKPPLKSKVPSTKSVLPAMRTLSERSTNLITNRTRRAR